MPDASTLRCGKSGLNGRDKKLNGRDKTLGHSLSHGLAYVAPTVGSWCRRWLKPGVAVEVSILLLTN